MTNHKHKQLNKFTLVTKAIRDKLKEAGYKTRLRSKYAHGSDTPSSLSISIDSRKKTKITINTEIRIHPRTWQEMGTDTWIRFESDRLLWKYNIARINEHDIADPKFDLSPICEKIAKFVEVLNEIENNLKKAHGIFEPYNTMDRRAYNPDNKGIRALYI